MDFPNQIKVSISYDDELQKITGKEGEPAIISENLPFVQFLYFIFSSYPDIQKKFQPGFIGFSINGKPATDIDIMQDGDELKIVVSKKI